VSLVQPGVPAELVRLSECLKGRAFRVVLIAPPPLSAVSAVRLAEIGFIPGEHVRVVARARPGGEPIAVRVGASTFALRRAEAECVLVRADGLGEGGP
jgi:ferrous iron transport protein A